VDGQRFGERKHVTPSVIPRIVVRCNMGRLAQSPPL
jgi:hypothetical protein